MDADPPRDVAELDPISELGAQDADRLGQPCLAGRRRCQLGPAPLGGQLERETLERQPGGDIAAPQLLLEPARSPRSSPQLAGSSLLRQRVGAANRSSCTSPAG